MTRTRILGIGSPAGDDQAGWLVIDALLSGRHALSDGIVAEKLDRPGANLVSFLENADRVVLIDAMQSDGEAGRIRHFDRRGWPAYARGLSTHGFGVLDALLLAQALDALPPQLDLYGIELASAVPGDEAGIEVRGAARRLAGIIAATLDTAGRSASVAPR